jgi:hypothetical protein
MIQTVMVHCITQYFIMAFMIKGYNVLKKYPEYNPAPAQLRYDVTVIYGAPESVFHKGKVKEHLVFAHEPLKNKTHCKCLHKKCKLAKARELTNPKRTVSKDAGQMNNQDNHKQHPQVPLNITPAPKAC